MMAVNSASDAMPSLACRPASDAIWIGPPMFDESIWPRHELPEALDRQHRHVPRLARRRSRRPRAGCRARSAPPWWRCRPGSGRPRAPGRSGPFSFTGVGRHRQRERLAVALDRRSSKVWPGRAAGSPATSSSGVNTGCPATAITTSPGLSPARSAGEPAFTELICGDELRPGADVPDLARLAEDRIADACVWRGVTVTVALGAVAAHRQLERPAVGRGDRALEVLPVRDRPAVDGDRRRRRCGARRRPPGRPRSTRPTTGGHTGRPSVPSTIGEDHGGQDEVHPGPGEDDEEARPQRLQRERLGRIVGRRRRRPRGGSPRPSSSRSRPSGSPTGSTPSPCRASAGARARSRSRTARPRRPSSGRRRSGRARG